MSVSWSVTKNTATNELRFEATGVIPIDLNVIREGDYVNISGSGFNVANQGSWRLTKVEVYYVTGTLHQAFELLNADGVAETASQTANSDLQFFRPTIKKIDGSASVLNNNDELTINIPATSKVVNRELGAASYFNELGELNVKQIKRDKNGTVTVYYDGTPDPTLSVNSFIFIDNIKNTPFQAFKSNGSVGTYPANGTTDASNLDCVSLLQTNTPDVGRKNFDVLKGANGDGVIVGGHTLVTGNATATNTLARFRPVSSATVSDATLADGATRYTYQWVSSAGTTNNKDNQRAAPILAGTSQNQILIFGGNDIALSAYSSVACILSNSTRKYNPATDTAASGSSTNPYATTGHTLTSLGGSNILAYGGGECTTTNNLLNGKNVGKGYIWNGLTEAFSTSPDITSDYPRAFHTATLFNQNNAVLLAGGLVGAKSFTVDSDTLAYWKMDDTGATLTDATGSFNLTDTGSAVVEAAKVGGGRDFTSQSASGAGSGAAETALLGEWTVEWWSCGYNGSSLAGYGDGVIVCYGGATESEPDNLLLKISIESDDLVFRWEESGGSDVFGSITIPGYIGSVVTDHYNYFAIRKRASTTPGLYDVDFFINGLQVATQTDNPNAVDGSNGQWYVAYNPESATAGFSGVIDELRISKVARSDSEIYSNFFNSCASIPTNTNPGRSHFIGPLQHVTEVWTGANPPTVVGHMMLARAFHTATDIGGGRVLVTGGLAYNPSNFPGVANGLYGPSASTNVSEIFNLTTRRWEQGPTFGVRRHKHTAIHVPSRNGIFIIGGESTQFDDCKTIEFLDLSTMKVSVLPEKLTYNVGGAVLLDTGILCVTNELDGSGGYRKIHQFISLESPYTSSTELNHFHRITEIGSGYLKVVTNNKLHFTNFGKPNNGNTFAISTGSRTSNVTTLVFSASGHSFVVGDFVFVNFQGSPASFGSGLKTVTAVTTNSISYAETAANIGSTSLTGDVYKNYSPDALVTGWVTHSAIKGPYILDPTGFSLGDEQSTVGGSLYSGIYQGQHYTVLPVVDATQFADAEGWVVLGYGTEYQVGPIRYYGRQSGVGLLIDSNYEFEKTIPAGTEVAGLYSREPFVPDAEFNGFYLTDSSSGRVGAQKILKSMISEGFDNTINIVYPGDRGLGNEGYPVFGNNKLSDKVRVWGSNDLDNEIKDLKE